MWVSHLQLAWIVLLKFLYTSWHGINALQDNTVCTSSCQIIFAEELTILPGTLASLITAV